MMMVYLIQLNKNISQSIFQHPLIFCLCYEVISVLLPCILITCEVNKKDMVSS